MIRLLSTAEKGRRNMGASFLGGIFPPVYVNYNDRGRHWLRPHLDQLYTTLEPVTIHKGKETKAPTCQLT